ncbi:MAG: hypothetical protein R3C03_09875 [Pirellulaceae bacterium]
MSSTTPPSEPTLQQIYNFFSYSISLPERAIRSSSAVVAGIVKESSSMLIPQSFQDSRSYKMFVTQMLDFVAQDIGGVQKETEDGQVEGFVAKKAVSNFVELAGLATLHVSPLTVLAVLSDVAYGSNTFLKELSLELKKQGVIAEDSTIDSTADLMSALSDTSGQTAKILDLPPLSLDGLQKTIQDTRDSLNKIDPTKLLPQKEMERFWQEMKSTAEENNVSIFDLGSAMTLYSLTQIGTAMHGALTTVRVTGNLFDAHIINHYRQSLNEIRERGFYDVVSESSKPYLDAFWNNFGSERSTITQDLLNGKLIGTAWKGLTGFLGMGQASVVEKPKSERNTCSSNWPPKRS